MRNNPLRARLGNLRRRLLLVGSTSSFAWGIQAAIVLLLAAAWLDLVWELSPAWRIVAPWAAGATGLAGAGLLAWKTTRAGRNAALARRLDQTAETGGDILTGLELDEPFRDRPTGDVTAGLARIAVDRAGSLAALVPGAKAVPARPLGRATGSLAILGGAVVLVAVSLPGLARTQWDRFRNPFADVPPFSRTTFEVTPGDVEVPYGSELEIRATAGGAPVEQVELVLEDGTEQQTLPMFPEPGGHWRAVLAKVADPAVYYVRSYRARSAKYRIRVLTVPRIEGLRLRIAPPAYTGQPPYEGPLPDEGVAGLPGTEVRVWARSNRPLSGGTLTVTGREEPVRVDMQPTAAGGHEVVGRFQVACDGKFSLRVIDVDGQRSRESFDGSITLLADARPFIRLLQPRTRSLATPNVSLPVVVSAEDDYGVSRVQLYRSLNSSRPLPAGFRLAERPPRRVDEQADLPLARYDLVPGDVIKLFGRVEDNDPAGAKGSESPVVTVQIISQEEFERLLRLRQGLEVLISKYRQAQRRMEGLANELEGLRKKLREAPPESPVAEDLRRRLKRLVRRLRDESEAIRRLTKTELPYDIDRNLAPELQSLARIPDQVAEQLEALLEASELHSGALARQLEKLLSELGSGREQFDRSAMGPLEHLEQVFPLIADQSRFVMLVLRQMDLAERLASLKGRDGEDSPALKIRMRDLEEEQRQIREELARVLDDVERHVERLPDEVEFDKLCETALKFADEVRASGALEAMGDAEAALAEFAGTRGGEKAQEAAEILQKFLKICQGGGGMAGAAGGCLVFQPALGNCLGDTVAQLLAAMGLGSGTGGGMGSGVGGMGGYGARRGGFGLYGGLPGMTGAFGGQYGTGSGPEQDLPGGLARESPGGANPDDPSWLDSSAAGAAGIGEAGVPVRYRRRVGQYFQRIAEELGGR